MTVWKQQSEARRGAFGLEWGDSLSLFSWLLYLSGFPADSAHNVCFSYHFPGWFFDWTQSYDLAFYLSGSCVVVGSLILFVLTLPCWNRKRLENDRPDVHYTSNCDKVASVAWIWAPFIRTLISPLLPSNCPLTNYTWTTSRRDFLSLTLQGFPPLYFCCQVLIYQNTCQRFWNTGISSVTRLRSSGSNILQIFLKVWLRHLCWFF